MIGTQLLHGSDSPQSPAQDEAQGVASVDAQEKRDEETPGAFSSDAGALRVFKVSVWL